MTIGIGFGFGIGFIARFCSGMWGYLTARVNGRTAVELERERNLGTAEAIKALPPGAELVENEPNGRLRVIRMPHTPGSLPPVIQPPVIDQVQVTSEITE